MLSRMLLLSVLTAALELLPVAVRAQPTNIDLYADEDPAALDDFRPDLDPYGEWVDTPDWGTVWVPFASSTGPDFQPYATNGHWAWDGDWTWVSDYPWGAVTFHYGRWVRDPRYGWVWIPGRRYAGAWVSWSASVTGDGWAGWCPTPPQWRWIDRRPVPLIRQPLPSYTFVPQHDLFAPRFGGHALVGPRAAPIARGARTWSSAPPAPRDFGFDPSRVPAPPIDHPALRHARQMAHPNPQPYGNTPRPPPQRMQPMPQPTPRVTPPLQQPQPRVTPPQPRALPQPTQPHALPTRPRALPNTPRAVPQPSASPSNRPRIQAPPARR